MNAKKLLPILGLTVVVTVGYFMTASFMHWGEGGASGPKSDPTSDPKWEKLRKEANSPLKTPEYLESLEESRREIARRAAEAEDHRLAPKHRPLSPESPLPPDTFPVVPDNQRALGELDKERYPDMAALFGLGPPDPTPLTSDELEAAIREIGEKREELTLPPVAEPGPNTAPHTPDDEVLGLYGQLQKLKASGGISDLAIRALRNGHAIVRYGAFAYGQPRAVQSVERASPPVPPETTDQRE